MLIAEARKQKNMTQKDLAAALHVSDRAVSKWERGAGFPDVSLLEPLADALGLQVLELLRGEEQEMPEMTVRHAVSLLVRQARERTRRRWGEIFGSVLLLAMTGFVLFGILDYSGAFLRPMSLTVTAAQIQWDAMDVEGFQDILYCRSGEFLTLGVERLLYITESMESFGLRLEDGTLIATDESYVPLLISDYHYAIRPVFSNQF